MPTPTVPRPLRARLGVCSWSLQPDDPETLVRRMKAAGLERVQLDLDPLRERPAVWGRAPAVLAEGGIEIVSGMFRCADEDYATLESIRRTGGLVPDATWERNRANAQATAEVAARLGLTYVIFHAGFLPHDAGAPGFGKLVDRVRQVARAFAVHGITLGCETGQESAPALAAFLDRLGEPNVAVNFDPANMILYGNGDPVAALRAIGPRVRGVHVKDAVPAKVPGTWGEEVVVGTGRVDWPAFFAALEEARFPGWLCLEREAGDRRVEDLRAGREFVEKTPRLAGGA